MSKLNIFKTVLGLILLGTLSPTSYADGFVCDVVGESLRIRVYNRTLPREGTRNAAIMVVSDPSQARGQRTIQRFQADNDGLTNTGARYVAVRRPQMALFSDRQVAGIQLGQIQELVLNIDFSYHQPVGREVPLEGTLEIYQVSGDQLWLDVDCHRYLKGSK